MKLTLILILTRILTPTDFDSAFHCDSDSMCISDFIVNVAFNSESFFLILVGTLKVTLKVILILNFILILVLTMILNQTLILNPNLTLILILIMKPTLIRTLILHATMILIHIPNLTLIQILTQIFVSESFCT